MTFFYLFIIRKFKNYTTSNNFHHIPTGSKTQQCKTMQSYKIWQIIAVEVLGNWQDWWDGMCCIMLLHNSPVLSQKIVRIQLVL